jgi:hypothetical protein
MDHGGVWEADVPGINSAFTLLVQQATVCDFATFAQCT